jgi:hypothetical protein
MVPTLKFPTGPITPHGAYHILHDRIPQVSLRAYDDSIVFHLMGGLAIPNTLEPESVRVQGITGLIPPWRMIDQKGATQDGTTFVDALYDPIEVNLDVMCKGRDPAHLRQLVGYLLASLDAKQESELSFTTHQLGRWWAKLRWYHAPSDKMDGVSTCRQALGLQLRADNGFWQSYPNVAEFRFSMATASDEFDVDYDPGMGSGWTIHYYGTGSGHLYVDDGQVDSTFDDDYGAVARNNGFTSATDNQVVEITMGAFRNFPLFTSEAAVDVWARMGNSDTAGSNGVRLRIERRRLIVSYFINDAETVMRERFLIVPPLPGEKFTLVAGVEGDPRAFRVLRGNATLMKFKENGASSKVGAAYRKAGLGAYVGKDCLFSTSAAHIRYWGAGDNGTVAQSGFLERINIGDQPFWDRYTVFGPGIFRFGNGPGSDDMVQFGPVEAGQVFQIRTDPRKRGVVDMTSEASTPQQLNLWQKAINDFFSFAYGNNWPALREEIESIFGIVPPQGNPYSLLDGRFSNPIPAKSPGNPAVPYYVKVEVDDGNADTMVFATGTPLRRSPVW